jgi:MFS family permease
MHLGSALSASGTAMPALIAQLDWGDNAGFYATILTSCAIAGIGIGATFGGSLVSKGRKRMVILFNIVGIISSCMSLILNTWVLFVARFLFGLASGIFICATPKILEESIPHSVMDNGYGISTNLFINIGIFISFLFGLGMPDSENPEEL